MTSLTVQNGALVLRGTSLGTGQGCCCGPSGPAGESCQYLACVTFEWDLEYRSWTDHQANKTTWIPSSGTATIRCADESRPLITLSLSSCFGSGATGFATAPTGYERAAMGPITSAGVETMGSGYAKLARVAPTLTVSGGSGTGLTVTPTVTATNDACGIPTWSITAVKFAGGTGYANGEALTVTTKAGDLTQVGAVLTVQTDPRSQPTLSASVSGGTGATLAVSTSSNGTTPQTWGVSGVSVTGTTSGYTDGAAVMFSYSANVTEQTKATAIIKTARTTPTITASVAGGSGASLTVNLSQSPTTPSDTALWHVDSVTVANGGTGYANGDPVTFAVTDGTQVTAASGTITTDAGRENPNLTPYVWGVGGTTGGSGASLSATMSPVQFGGQDYWTVASIAINNGGSGYAVGEYIGYEEIPSFVDEPPYYIYLIDGWLITSVDGSGAITGVGIEPGLDGGLFYKATGNGVIQSVTITEDGDYYKPTGEISRVVVTNPGQHYYYTGVPTGVTITNGGQYYREDASLPPYVADVTVTINQLMPSDGTGASISAVVQDDTSSAAFGQVVGFTIDNGGNGYLARRTPHPDGLLLLCLDSNGYQWENLAPTFPITPPRLEWKAPGVGVVPGEVFGFPGPQQPICCFSSFLVAPDYGFAMPIALMPAPRNQYFELNDVNDLVVIRGTVMETVNPIWFAEDCDCANPLP